MLKVPGSDGATSASSAEGRGAPHQGRKSLAVKNPNAQTLKNVGGAGFMKKAIQTHKRREFMTKLQSGLCRDLRHHLLQYDTNILRIWRNTFDPQMDLRVNFADFCKHAERVNYKKDCVSLFVEAGALYDSELEQYKKVGSLIRTSNSATTTTLCVG